MAKPDGRIEKGQRLSTAISARAWNRAQDAADIVLGVRPGVSVPAVSSVPDFLTVRIPKNSLHIPTDPLEIGHGIAISQFFSFAGQERLVTSLAADVQLEDDLPKYDDSSASIVTAPTSNALAGARCGIIESISSTESDNHIVCRVRVRGIVRCRVLFLTQGTSVSPPPPKPVRASLQQYWRRYLLATEYGHGTILALGARFRLGDATFPCIYEALVQL